MKKYIVSIILSELLLIAACSLGTVLQPTDTMATKIADASYATQTAASNLQQLVNATVTKMAQDVYATQTALAFQVPVTAIPTSTPAPLPTPTTQANSQAVVTIESVNIRSGPGTTYSVQAYAARGDILIILGQAYDCGWLEIRMPDGQTGWVSSTYVTYSLPCGAIAQASIPPEPTPATQASSCDPSGSIDISNTTGGTVTLYLSGPASYTFTLGTGDTTISVCPGTYSYTAYGCGGASTSGTMSTGESHEFYCS
jgi:Bacterial SH3 domain